MLGLSWGASTGMDAQQLKDLQAPIKATYRDEPGKAEGDLDFRGTLGVDKTAPVGFRDIRLSFDLDGDLNEDQKAQLQNLTERYCVVYQTLRNPPQFAVSLG